MLDIVKGWLTAQKELWTIRYLILFKGKTWSEAQHEVYLDWKQKHGN